MKPCIIHGKRALRSPQSEAPPWRTLSVGSTLAPVICCPGVIRDGKRPRLLTGSLGSTTKAFAAGFFSKSKSSPTPDLDTSLEFLDLASEYSLLERVSNLWFPSNGSVLYYRTWLVCISIMRQAGHQPASQLPGRPEAILVESCGQVTCPKSSEYDPQDGTGDAAPLSER